MKGSGSPDSMIVALIPQTVFQPVSVPASPSAGLLRLLMKEIYHVKFRVSSTMLCAILVVYDSMVVSIDPNCVDTSHYLKLRAQISWFMVVVVFVHLLEYRELKNRGVDPSIGWKGNVEKWNGKGLKPPFVATAMVR